MASSLADINSQIKKHDEQIAQLRKQAEDLRNQERAGVIEELRKKIAEYGLTAADLKLAARGGRRGAPVAAVKSAAKYRSPTGETWSGGRGRRAGRGTCCCRRSVANRARPSSASLRPQRSYHPLIPRHDAQPSVPYGRRTTQSPVWAAATVGARRCR